MAACFVFIVVAADWDAASHLHIFDIPGAGIETVWLRDDGVINVKFTIEIECVIDCEKYCSCIEQKVWAKIMPYVVNMIPYASWGRSSMWDTN